MLGTSAKTLPFTAILESLRAQGMQTTRGIADWIIQITAPMGFVSAWGKGLIPRHETQCLIRHAGEWIQVATT